MSERRKLMHRNEGGPRSRLFPIIIAGSLGASVLAAWAAFERNGIDPAYTASSVVSVCDGMSSRESRRQAYAAAYAHYVVNSAGNMENRFQNLDRATRDCGDVGSFTFDTRPSVEPSERLIEPADATQ